MFEISDEILVNAAGGEHIIKHIMYFYNDFVDFRKTLHFMAEEKARIAQVSVPAFIELCISDEENELEK